MERCHIEQEQYAEQDTGLNTCRDADGFQ